MNILLAAIFLWLIPIFVASSIGKPKHRAGFLYGFFLGWIGVLVLAVLPPASEMTLEQLERRKRNMTSQQYELVKADILSSRTTRECPHCKETMRRDASVCPHCQRDSTPWRLHEGRWWAQSEDKWFWLDEFSNEWLPAG